MNNDLSQVRAIAALARAYTGRALVVGGAVRDQILGRDSKDFDVEVYGIREEGVRSMLSDMFGRDMEMVGESFKVFKAGNIDVSLPRRDSKVGDGHKGFRVTADPYMSVTEAARRRDFTMNAIAWDPLTDEYLDPFGGRNDIANKVMVRVDPDTFADDSLRVLRGCQFAARFGFDMDAITMSQCLKIDLSDLPGERIWGELEKLLLAPQPSRGLELARALGVIRQLFPELDALIGCPQEPSWHPEGDVWVHTLQVLDRAREECAEILATTGVSSETWDPDLKPIQLAVMLGALCHDFGKPSTTAVVDGRIRSLGHEEAGVAPTRVFLDRLKVHSLDGYDVRRQVLAMVQYHLSPGAWFKTKDVIGNGAFRRLALKVDLELLSRVARADSRGRAPMVSDVSAMAWFTDRAKNLGVQHKGPEPLLMGRHLLDLGMKPGPAMGKVLKAVYERQLDGDVSTLGHAIGVAKEMMEALA